MYTPDDLLNAVKAIRPSLPELLGSDAEQVDRQLANLIDRYQLGEPVENEIATLLAHYEQTRKHMEKILLNKKEVTRNFILPGLTPPPLPPKYICPQIHCDHVWYRHQMGPIPTCPVHNTSLVLAKDL